MKITMDGKYAYRKDPYTQVRILCVDRPCTGYPVVAMEESGEESGNFSFHTAQGLCYINERDLVPLKEKLPDLWVNIYKNGKVFAHLTEESAVKAVTNAYGETYTDLKQTVKYIPAPDQTS